MKVLNWTEPPHLNLKCFKNSKHLVSMYRYSISIFFSGIVAYLAEIVTPTELVTMLPKKENAKFLPHVKRCIAKHQAKNLRDIIIAKGFELKSIV